MISDHGISLDEEALIYQKALYGDIVEEECPQRIIPERPQSKRSAPSAVPKFVCFRCGGLGHLSAMCHDDLPTADEIQREMFNDINDVINEAQKDPSYSWDKYGLYKNNTETPVSHKKSWRDGVFCTNCGLFGHTAKQCTSPSFSTLEDALEPFYRDRFSKPAKPLSEIEEVFRDELDL